MTSSYRRCCCGTGGPPGGGYCEDTTLQYQVPHLVDPTTYEPLESSVVPNYMALTLPESLDLSMYRREDCDDPLGIVSLCTVAQPYVLKTTCLWLTQKFASLGATCPSGAYIRSLYTPNGTRCYLHPRVMWEFGWSAMLADFEPPYPPSNYPTGITQPGRVYTRVLVRVPVKDSSGNIYWLWFSNTQLGEVTNWPTYLYQDGDPPSVELADREAWAEAEHDFLLGNKGLPKTEFEGDFYLYEENSAGFFPHVSRPCDCAESEVSFDPAYEAWKGRPSSSLDNGCIEHCCDDRDVFWPEDPRTLYCGGTPTNVGFAGFIVQSGDLSLEPSDDNASLLYLPATETCNAELQCADGCLVDQPSGFGASDILVNALPAQIFLELPAEITVDYRDGACGNFDTLAPDPWTRQAPATSLHGLEIDPELAPACGPYVYATNVGKPWRGIVSPLTDNWENIGLVVTGEYRPGVSCEGEAHRATFIHIGFVFIDPVTVAQADRRCRLFTMAEVRPYVEKLDGTEFGNAGELYSINLGPEFRFGDYASDPSVADGDDIRTFAQVSNAWDWTHNFVFENFYFAYLPSSTGSCEGYSFPPDAYSTSIAQALSSIADVGDYCGEASGYPVCGRGDNHAYALRITPASGTPTPLRSLTNLRYCSTGAPCSPPSECGGMFMMAAAAPVLIELDAAERAGRIAAANAKIDARQQANRAVCESCPSGLWNAAGEYCEQIYKTCRCATPEKRSRDKTITAQRQANCPKGHFTREVK